MRRLSLLSAVGWPLLGLLAIAGMLMALGHREVEAFPAYDSIDPSGASVFAELLRREGYSVTVDRRPTPHLQPSDVAIVFTINVDAEEETDHPKPFLKQIAKFATNGGRVLFLPLDQNFQAASRIAMRAGPEPVLREYDQAKRKVSIGEEGSMPNAVDGLPSGNDLDLWSRGNDTFIRGTSVGKGLIVRLLDGIGATNRFIATADNAEVLTSVLRSIAPKGAHVVFAEAGFGNQRSPSLTTMLGQWAAVAWYQMLFAILVVAYSLGKRFGMPEEDRIAQRGTRELVDAIAITYQRGRMSRVALQAALDDADARIRKAWRIPLDASEGERDRVLPEELMLSIRRAKIALTQPRLRQADALSLARDLDRHVRESLPS